MMKGKRPAVLDLAVLKANARVWRRHAGVALRAAVKSDGYGWGIADVVRAVDESVDGYCVVDFAEFDSVRRASAKPVALIGDIPPHEIARLLDGGGIPNLSDGDAIAAAGAWARERGKPARVRVGLRSAVAWAGIDERDVAPVAALLARETFEVECWTHLTDPTLYVAQRAQFARFVDLLRAANIAIVGCDLDATASCAADPTHDRTSVRIGVGLFGSGAARVEGVSCAISVRAPIVRVVPAEGQPIGYGTAHAPREGYLTVVRCGYGDGFPRIVEPFGSILSVGMQNAVVASVAPPGGTSIELVTSATNLDGLAAAARLVPHDVVVRLGHAKRVQSAVQ